MNDKRIAQLDIPRSAEERVRRQEEWKRKMADEAIQERLERDNEALRKELAEAKEREHYANGVTDLAMIHRDMSEKELAEAKARITELDHECKAGMEQISFERARAERAEATSVLRINQLIEANARAERAEGKARALREESEPSSNCDGYNP